MQGKACLSFTPRGVPEEGLSVRHVVCPRYSEIVSRGQTHTSVWVWPRETNSERGARGSLVRHTCSLSSGIPRGVPGEGLSVILVVSPLVFQEGCQGKAVCPSCRLSLYPHFPAHPTACIIIIPAN